MYGVLIALIPAFICSVLFFGMGAIIVTLTSVVACLFFEYVIQKFLLKQQPTIFDGSALYYWLSTYLRTYRSGLSLSVPWWQSASVK